MTILCKTVKIYYIKDIYIANIQKKLLIFLEGLCTPPDITSTGGKSMTVYEITITVRMLLMLGIIVYFTIFIVVEASKREWKNEIRKDLFLWITCLAVTVLVTALVMKYGIKAQDDWLVLIGNYCLVVMLVVKSICIFMKIKNKE